MKCFEEIQAWQKARELVREIYRFARMENLRRILDSGIKSVVPQSLP
jgi:hypothetical protein